MSRDTADSGAVYDRYASQYDALLSENRINAYMRRAMRQLQDSAFPDGSRLMEVGCGTGDEALALASRGCEIVAVDPSSEMIRTAERKAEHKGLANKVSFRIAYARDLKRILSEQGDGSFDGAYSSFALSYEPTLAPVRDALARFIRPGGAVLVSAMNRLSLVEWGIAMLTLHPALAGRRLRPSTMHKVGTLQTPVYPRTAGEMLRAFTPGFVIERIRALPAILPPHYANRLLLRWPALMETLVQIDPWLGERPGLKRLGDHNILLMRRVHQGDRR